MNEIKKDGIIFVMDAEHGTTYHRILMPAYAMKQMGYNVYIVKSLVELQTDIDLRYVKAIVFSRMIAVRSKSVIPNKINKDKYKKLPTHETFRKMLNAYGITIVVDIDDRWEIDYNGNRKHQSSYNQLQKLYIKDSLKVADVIWCGSKYLCKLTEKELSIPKERIHYLPNGINETLDVWKPTPMPDKELTFGYTGAAGHITDVRLLGGVFDKRPLQVTKFDDVDYMEVFGKMCYGVDWKTLDEYPTLYHDFHVSIAPLENTKFNNCKSNLKVVESGFKKRAIIVSDVPLYTELIKHGLNGIVCKTKYDWQKEIDAMTKEKAFDLAEALYESIKDSHNIYTLNNIRIQSINANIQ